MEFQDTHVPMWKFQDTHVAMCVQDSGRIRWVSRV